MSLGKQGGQQPLTGSHMDGHETPGGGVSGIRLCWAPELVGDTTNGRRSGFCHPSERKLHTDTELEKQSFDFYAHEMATWGFLPHTGSEQG